MSSYLQYGCGHHAPAGWRSFDASPSLRLERIPLIGRLYTKNARRFPAGVELGDIVRGLPVAAGSVRGVYASHVLEHLALHDFRVALRNTYALLEAGGIFRLVVPDLEQLARRYLDSKGADAAEQFMLETGLGTDARPRSLAALAASMLGNSRHLWMWDYRGLEHELAAAGFTRIRRCALGDSEDPAFTGVEQPDRFEQAVAVEARRPER